MSELSQLQVRLSGRLVGKLSRNREGVCWWIPDDSWEKDDQRPTLGRMFRVEPGPRKVGSGLLPWFDNLLPEPGTELRKRLLKLHRLEEGDPLGLLRVLGTDLPGATEIVASESPPSDEAKSNAKELAVNHTEGLENAMRFSLAGMQLKLSMAAQDHRMVLTSKSGDRRWIVKLPGRYAELPEVEFATMEWARASGYKVPRTIVIPSVDILGLPDGWIENSPTVYAIERFDRRDDGTRVHHEDFCQALGLLSLHKYGDTGRVRVDLAGLVRLVQNMCDREKDRGEAEEFCQRIGFMIASGNDDGHLKNWSFEWGSADRPRLSPCYDLVCTVAWPTWQKADGPTLALGFGGEREFRRLGRPELERFGKKSGGRWACDAVMAGIERAYQSWPSVRHHAPERMIAALKTQWASVPLLQRVGTLDFK